MQFRCFQGRWGGSGAQKGPKFGIRAALVMPVAAHIILEVVPPPIQPPHLENRQKARFWVFFRYFQGRWRPSGAQKVPKFCIRAALVMPMAADIILEVVFTWYSLGIHRKSPLIDDRHQNGSNPEPHQVSRTAQTASGIHLVSSFFSFFLFFFWLLKFIIAIDPGGGGPQDKRIKHQQPNRWSIFALKSCWLVPWTP